jgi:KRAB domain-containing zinc finger protein
MQKVHEQRKDFWCMKCDKFFGWKESFDRHIKNFHSETREIFECKDCKMQFFQKVGLEGHYKTVHLNLLDHKCEICGKAYGRKGSLYLHMKTHGEVESKPEQCPECKQMYKTKGSLLKHIQLEHMMLRPYVCGLCGETFKSQQKLSSHHMLHLNNPEYLCDLCNRFFTTQDEVTDHIEKMHIVCDESTTIKMEVA